MINHKLKCIQIHIPKTAGVCIRTHLFNKEPDRYMHFKPYHPIYIEYWNKYFTFTFVRNPFDRLVSGYFFTLEKAIESNNFNQYIKDTYKTFEQFILNVNRKQLLKSLRYEPQINWFKKYGYDFIGRQENLQEDFNFICDKLKIDRKELTKVNQSKTRTKFHYTEYYNDKTKQIVESLYKEDLEYFNYKFGE